MKKQLSFIVFITLLATMLFCTINIRPARAWIGTAYITILGDVSPWDAPIQRNNDYYTLTGDIVSPNNAKGLVIERSNIVFDGGGKAIQGSLGGHIGILMYDLTNVTVKNTNVTKYYHSEIEISVSTNITLLGNNVTGWDGQYSDTGIEIDGLYSNVTGNSVTGTSFGINIMTFSYYNLVSSNNVTGNLGTGIYVGADNNTLVHNNVTQNSRGIEVRCTNSTLTDNNVTANSLDGIYVREGYNCTLSGNTVNGNGGSGICLNLSSSFNKVIGNVVYSNAGNGIWFNSSSFNDVLGNNVTNNVSGIRIEASHNITVSGNRVVKNTQDGIYLNRSEKNKMSDNNITENVDGIHVLWGLGFDTVSGNNITANVDSGIHLVSTSYNYALLSNNLTQNAYGIWSYSAHQITISDNQVVKNSKDGMYFYNSRYNTVSGNNITGNGGNGICLNSSSSFNEVLGNNITENAYGIWIDTSDNVTISGNCAVKNAQDGIFIHKSWNNTVSNNNVTENSNCGVHIYYDSAYNTISDNNLTKNAADGIFLNVSASFNQVADNNLTGNHNGIHLYINCINNTLFGNSLTENDNGIWTYYSDNNTISNNNITGKTGRIGDGIYLEDSSYNTATGNRLSESDKGIHLYMRCFNNTLSDNYVNRNNDGMMLQEASDDNTIVENNVTENLCGIRLDYSSDNDIRWNNVTANIDYGIFVDNRSMSNWVNMNNLTKNYYGVFLNSSLYYNDISDSIVTENTYGVYVNSSSTYNAIYRNKVTENTLDGIHLDFNSDHNLIFANNVSANKGNGIYADSSSYNSVGYYYGHPGEGNNITGNNGYGIVLEGSSDYNNITNNVVDSDVNGGVFVDDCLGNNISRNSITSNNFYGLKLNSSPSNIITENNVTEHVYGIHLTSSSDNMIYHNNWDNAQQVYSSLSTNFWNDSYPSGGNYWSGYEVTDTKIGRNQDVYQEGKSDGIGDVPYVIDDIEDRDRLPLMEPWPTRHLTTTVQDQYGGTLPVSVETNTTITCPIATKNILSFTSSGQSGAAYVSVIFPMGLNTSVIKVYIDEEELVPPPFPVITEDGTNYFIYFEYTQSDHGLDMQFVNVDMAVINVTRPKTVVGQGYSINMTATVRNQGDREQTFNITFNANQIIVGSLRDNTLPSNQTMTFMYPWNTGSCAKGNYTTSFNTEPDPDEMDKADNSMPSGLVIVTIPGDTDGDKTVDIYDAIRLSGAYGTEIGMEGWNPNVDINNDGIVDIFDAIILSGHYDETWI